MNLSELAININSNFKESNRLYEIGIEHLHLAVKCDKVTGDLLIQVKNLLPHGQFISWVEVNCEFSIRHAQYLMRISRESERIFKVWDATKNEVDFVFLSPLLRLKNAIALTASEPKPEAPPPIPITKYKVALKEHECYGEVVEVQESMQHGDVVLCKTSKGEYPFLRKELVAETLELTPIDAEVVDTEVTDNSEQLKQAIAIVIEYLPEEVLKAVLTQALAVGTDYLPSDAQGMVAKLIGSKETLALSNSASR